MTGAIHICDFRSEPAETECREAMWSDGTSCKRCYRDCYRKDWTKGRVLADNAKRVRRKREEAIDDSR